MKRIKIDRSKCVGCLTCVTACTVSHGESDSRCRITADSTGKYAPIFCRHCDKPECVYTCMSGAMTKQEDGKVMYNKDICASCYMCIMACPYGVLKADDRTQKFIMKCDACESVEGDTVQCVSKCPMQAIVLEEV